MFKAWLSTLAVVATSVAGAGDLDDLWWSERFDDLSRWTAEPSWLGNPTNSPSLVQDDSAACFGVYEVGRGMKWSAAMPAILLDEFPYLVVHYRAENLNTDRTDYLVYLDDGISDKELNAVRLCDVVADGQWHVAAVDLTELTRADEVTKLAVQVQAGGKANARLWLKSIVLVDVPPENAEIIQRTQAKPPKDDWIAPLAEATWMAQPSWLANPVAEADQRVSKNEDGTTFRVAVPGCGMKWSWDLPASIELEAWRYVAIRYRAIGARPVGDYAVCGTGTTPNGQSAYRALVPAEELACDGRWHTLVIDNRRVAAKLPVVDTLAVQVQAAEPGATLEVSDLRLTNHRPLGRLGDAVASSRDVDWRGFRAVPLATLASGESRTWCRHLRIDRWFDGPEMTVEGIPFQLVTDDTDLATTPVRQKTETRFPMNARASEVFILMLAAMTGMEEPPYGSGRLRAVRDVDRFRLRLEYADGTIDECLPMNLTTRQFGVASGVQVVVAATDQSTPLAAVVLCDRSRQAGFAVAAITARTTADRLVPEALEETSPLRIARAAARRQVSLELDVQSGGSPILKRLVCLPSGWNCLGEPCPMVTLKVDGKEDVAESGIQVSTDLQRVSEAEYSLVVRMENTTDKERIVDLTAPAIGPYRLSERAEDAWYLLPRRGAAFDNRPWY